MITYWYTIDKYNSVYIEEVDGEEHLINISNNISYMDSAGWDLRYKSSDDYKQRVARYWLKKIFSGRNFHMYHRRQKEYGEECGIFPI